MSLTSVLIVSLVAYGALSAYADLLRFVERCRRINRELDEVLAFEERQRALRPDFPRSLPK